MPDDIDKATTDVQSYADNWGSGSFIQDTISKIVVWCKGFRDRLASLEADRDTTKTAIQDLRTRVKALEDKAP